MAASKLFNVKVREWITFGTATPVKEFTYALMLRAASALQINFGY
jgi:hypothetical protein